MMRGKWLWLVVAGLSVLGGNCAFAQQALPQVVEFNRDIRPILSENCFKCHGPDKNQRKADLRLDVREIAVEAEAIVPGKPEASEAIRRIFETDEDERMPPLKANRTLTEAQKQTLKRWVAEGAT